MSTAFSVPGGRSWRPVVVFLALALASCAGCGKSIPTGTVSGTVTLGGAPFSDGAVIFLSFKSGKAESADIQADGKFTIAKPLPVDTYTVYLAPKAAPPSDQPKPVSIDKSVPDKYWNEATSDIKIDVVAGKNDVKVALVK